MKGIAVKVPCVEELDCFALILRPCITIRKGCVKSEHSDSERNKKNCRSTANLRMLFQTERGNPVRSKVEDLAHRNNGEVECWEIMMQEKLSCHEIERKVVQRPAQYGLANFVVKSLEGDIGIVVAASLPSEDSNALEDDICQDREGRRPPDGRISEKVDLTMVFTPEVDTTSQDWPGTRPGIPGMRLNKACVGLPHNLL